MLQAQLGLRLLLLTGGRIGELRLATPDQFHLDQGLWIIPPEVVKQLQLEMRKERIEPTSIPPYIVPLSAQAQEIVRYLLEQRKPAQKHTCCLIGVNWRSASAKTRLAPRCGGWGMSGCSPATAFVALFRRP
ncbi:hypothetical protein V1234_09465 [Serratia marcescens]|nr:hypothetical protein [Serratia marcescens]WVJ44392.1 hypothetical protein V1234_09465 [Serratia marcescens]